MLTFAGVEDVFTSARGHTKTLGNFAKATFAALGRTYGFLTPDLWKDTKHFKDLYHEHSDFLAAAKDQKVHRLRGDEDDRY